MPVYKESKFAEYRVAFKEWRDTAKTRLGEWKDAVREEPALIWQTTAIRYTVYALGGFMALFSVLWLLSLFQPAEVRPPARTADFHVLCTNRACGRHFVINRKFNFDDFPVVCPECQQKTGYQAMRCTSKQCGGRWVISKAQAGDYRCSQCGEFLGRVD